MKEIEEKLLKKVEALEKQVFELKAQIEELTKNPPLEFDEIKSGERIWDSKNKYHLDIHDTYYNESTDEKFLQVDLGYCPCPILFEEGRYYRKELANERICC